MNIRQFLMTYSLENIVYLTFLAIFVLGFLVSFGVWAGSLVEMFRNRSKK